MTPPTPLTLSLTGAIGEPALARDFVTHSLTGFSPSLTSSAVLLVSELVTNVYQHGRPPAYVKLFLGDPVLRVAVFDSGSDLPLSSPSLPSVPDAAVSGRGLVIVAALARAWGVEANADASGKSVWFELDDAS